MKNRLSEPLNDEELDRLDDFLLDRMDGETSDEIAASDGDEGILGVSKLDGFLTALVKVHDMQGLELKDGERPENVGLQFNPNDVTSMFVPCIWSRWERGAEVLYSMALITDEPPEEVSRAGHDRCPINLTQEAALAWLEPGGRSTAELFDILNQRHRPIYQHRLAEAA